MLSYIFSYKDKTIVINETPERRRVAIIIIGLAAFHKEGLLNLRDHDELYLILKRNARHDEINAYIVEHFPGLTWSTIEQEGN